MHLSQLAVRNFRNIESLELTPGPQLNIIYGKNAQGKTSLLESIFLLSTLRSFRTSKTQELIKEHQAVSQVSARLEGTQSLFLKHRLTPEKRELQIDEKNVRPRDFIKKVRTVIFSPESLSTIKQGPEGRRLLLDQSTFQIFEEAADSQTQFERALKQRNSALKQIKQQTLGLFEGRKVVESLTPGYLQAATQVSYLRLKLMDEMAPRMSKIASLLMGEKVAAGFCYRSSDSLWTQRSLNEIHSRLLSEINTPNIRAAEEALGVTLVGPHRHDLNFLFNGKDSKIYCSQGQQRALILSFKMAEIVYHDEAFGQCPILLLDDVLSEFDEDKRRFLVEFLKTSRAQTFLTTTDRTELDWPACSEFQMSAGKLG